MAKDSFSNMKFFTSCEQSEHFPSSTLPEFVFVGKSNVGKSSILNKLCNNKNLAKTSSTPGKTTNINFFINNYFCFVDLPGYGFSKRSKSEQARWSKLMDDYFNNDRNIYLIILLLDIRHKPTNLDFQMIDYLKSLFYPFMICLTKADKLSKQKQILSRKEITKLIDDNLSDMLISTSSNSGLGIEKLKEIINNCL